MNGPDEIHTSVTKRTAIRLTSDGGPTIWKPPGSSSRTRWRLFRWD